MDWPEFEIDSGGDIEDFNERSIEAFTELNDAFIKAMESLWPYEGSVVGTPAEFPEGFGQGATPYGGDASETVQRGFQDGGGI